MAKKISNSIHLSVFLWSVVLTAADMQFAFDEDIYAHVIKSTSKPNSPLFHIKAPHCKYGKLEYKILENNHPFQVSSHNGSVYLPHALDPNSPTDFMFNIQVNDANSLCYATAQVQVFVVHVNEHKPIMSATKYYCTVNEDERVVEIKPKIRATDKDEGQAGKIRAIRIREQGVPFKVVLEENGYAKLVASEDLDAESISEYRFSIYAVDNGKRARKSERSRVYCHVVDVNEFAPIFKHPSYDIEILRGKTYEKIIQLEAVDQDISNKKGKVCNYAIVENGIPFSVDKNGFLSLQEELPAAYPNHVLFHVRATDCAGKNSDDDVVVRVKIKNQTLLTSQRASTQKPDCKPVIMVKDVINLQYPSCTKDLALFPNIKVNECNDMKEHSISVKAILDSSSVRKGCERSHDPVTSIYSKCGSDDVVELLSNPTASWIEDLITEETAQGETNYIFDGNFAARLPKEIIGENWHERFTIAAWLLVKTSSKPQFILSLSNGMKFGYSYVGLYAINKYNYKQPRIGFYMSKENGKCRFHEEWEVSFENLKWRHVAVVVDQCNLQLQIDGVPMEPIGAEESLQPQQPHIQPKYVIGGRWLGTNQKYTDFFKGKISQIIFTKSTIKNFDCILACEENLDLKSPLPDGFQLEKLSNKKSIYITGRGSLSYLQKILKGIIYFNRLPYPTAIKRKVFIESKLDGSVLSTVKVDIETPKNDRPNIKLMGKCNNNIKSYGSLDSGFRLCPDISGSVKGCLKTLDEALVVINSDIIGTGNLSVPTSVLQRFGLTATFSTNVLRILGVARYTDYIEVLRNVFYIPSVLSQQENIEIKLEVSAETGRFSSNELIVGIKVKHESKEGDKDSPMSFVLHLTSESTAGSFTVNKNKSSSQGKGALVVAVILSLTVVVAVAGFGALKLHRSLRENETVQIDMRTTDLLWDDEGLPPTMNITLNPLLRFRHDSSLSDGNLSENSRNSFEESSEASLYWSESDDENESDREATNALEWDCSYHEDFGEMFDFAGECTDEEENKVDAICEGEASLSSKNDTAIGHESVL